MPRQFGRVFRPDPRDRNYPVQLQKTKLTRKVWSTGSQVLDQGEQPACVGYAIAHQLLSAPIHQYLNPLGIYSIAKRFDEWAGEDYEGTSVRAGMEVLRMLGLVDEYRWAFSLEEVINTVLTTGPVVMGVNWYEGMSTPDAKNFIHVTGENLGGHAILLVGVDTKLKYGIFHQSWGPYWGKQGRCQISFSDLAQLLAEDGDACLAVDRRAR